VNYRIEKLREFLFNIINTLTEDRNYQINADFLGNEGNYSLDKIPTESVVEKWVTGVEIHRDVYSLRSRKPYSQDTINNLSNIGFFEDFENKIKSSNKEGVLPDINGIESVECLNCGTINGVNGDEATFDIQIQITYRNNGNGGEISL
jgi:hypothetical protein